MIKRVVTRANCLIFFGPELCKLGSYLPSEADFPSPERRIHGCCIGIPTSGHICSRNAPDLAAICEAVRYKNFCSRVLTP